jgi:hypothetical protein
VRGSPIRTPSDQRSVGSSPRLIAASHVLHRLLVPRHPPYALTNLATKMLASTVQFSKYGQARHHHAPRTRNQTTSPATSPRPQRQPTHNPHQGPPTTTVLVPSGPNSVPHTTDQRPMTLPAFHPQRRATTPEPQDPEAAHSILLRKEVIQPHLPVRLPCYDFVPIASPTFDGSPPHRVRPPASGVTDFRDVTGGVYKARERIHRSIADLRLLATPTSRGRVAYPDPN